MRHIALLRGINVGGKNILPMKDLAAMFTDAGCSDVKTYIQSGNVIFRTTPTKSARIAGLITERIRAAFGYDIPIIIRSASQFDDVIRRNPFLKKNADEKMLGVMFLADTPKPEMVIALDPQRSPSDEFIVHCQEIYLYLPNGAARTKLTNAWFDSALKTVSTGRNWRTVNKLHELAQSL